LGCALLPIKTRKNCGIQKERWFYHYGKMSGKGTHSVPYLAKPTPGA
jgi:hypothetical protein